MSTIWHHLHSWVMYMNQIPEDPDASKGQIRPLRLNELMLLLGYGNIRNGSLFVQLNWTELCFMNELNSLLSWWLFGFNIFSNLLVDFGRNRSDPQMHNRDCGEGLWLQVGVWGCTQMMTSRGKLPPMFWIRMHSSNSTSWESYKLKKNKTLA